jgi:hypothetical protein
MYQTASGRALSQCSSIRAAGIATLRLVERHQRDGVGANRSDRAAARAAFNSRAPSFSAKRFRDRLCIAGHHAAGNRREIDDDHIASLLSGYQLTSDARRKDCRRTLLTQ